MRKWEKYEYQFPRFSPIQWIWLRNWRGNPCITHMMKYTTGWESNGKKQSYYGKSVGTYFPGFLHSSGFAIFSMIWENDEKTLAFPILWSIPRDRNLMEKTTILWKLHTIQFPRLPPFERFCRLFHDMGEYWGNPSIFHMMKYTTGWEPNEKSIHTNRNYIQTNFPGFPHSRGFATFSMIWENNEKTHPFPIWWSIPSIRI